MIPWIHTQRTVAGLMLAGALATAATVEAQKVGPARGALLLAGGGAQDQEILERFIALAGGPEAPLVVIPTASGADQYHPYSGAVSSLQALGAKDVQLLHTYDPKVANTETFVRPLKAARGVWFSGGRQWRLADAYLDTEVHRQLQTLLDRGGVIGGTSAGATIQGSYLARGDTRTNTIMLGDHIQGLGFLRDVAVDQHILKRNRQFDLIEIVTAHPHLLGIGLDEDTAIVVQGDRFEVIGQSYVAIYDHQRMIDSGGRFYFLAPGDQFDLETRSPFRISRTPEPLERVVERSWAPQ